MSKSLIKSTSTVSFMTMISRIFGFVRDMVAAQVFGVNAAVDAFYVAFKIPNFMRSLFAEGSFAQAFVPVLSEYRQKKTHLETREFISAIAGCLSLVLLIVVIIGLIITPIIIMIWGPGLGPERFTYATYMLRIMMPYLMLISLTAFVGSILNSYGMFSVPSFAPTLLNMCLVLSALFLAPYFKVPVEAQAWGVLAAGFSQLFFQIPFLYKKGFLVWPKVRWRHPGVIRVLKLMIPAILGTSVVQVSMLFNTIFASFLKVGSISWLYYSDRLAYFPLGVFGVALATVVLPHLSRKHADKNPEQFTKALDWGLRCNLLIGIPASLVLALLATPIIATLFGHGKFNVYDILMTSQSTIAYAFGIQAFMLVKLLAAAFYARQDIKTPVKIAILAVMVNIILNALLIYPFQHAGLALATSLSSWLNVTVLFWMLLQRNIFKPQGGWGIYLLRLGVSNVITISLLWYLDASIETWLSWGTALRLEHLIFLFVVAMVTYFICLGVTGLKFRHLRLVE